MDDNDIENTNKSHVKNSEHISLDIFNKTSILDSIFEKDFNSQTFIPKIKSLSPLKNILNDLSDPSLPLSNKETLLITLSNFIISNPYIANILLSETNSHNISLYEIILSILFDKAYSNEKEFKQLSLEFLKILTQYTQCPIKAYNYCFSQIAKEYNLYLPGYSQFQNENIIRESKCIDINKFEEYYNILQVIYSVWKPGITLTKDPKSYIYITQESSINVVIENTKNINKRIIKASTGLGMSMWICPKMFPNENEKCFLMDIDYFRNSNKPLRGKFQIILNSNGNICLLCKNQFSEESQPIKRNNWYRIDFNIIPSNKQFTVKCEIIINEGITQTQNNSTNKIEYNLSKDIFHRDSEILSIELLQNYIGLFGGYCVFDGDPNLPQFNFNLNEELDTFWKRLSQSKQFELKYHLCLFPFTSHYSSSYSKPQIIIESFIHCCYGTLHSHNKANGIYTIPNNLTNIFLKEGINNFIPIMEIIYTHRNILYNNPEGTNLISKYLIFIFKLMLMLKDSVTLAFKNGFFTCFSVFLEQFPRSYFNEEIQEIIISCVIGEQKSKDDIVSQEIFNFIYNYHILNKFSFKKQKQLLSKSERLCSIYINSNPYYCLDKMLYILSKYDKDNKNKYCCKVHKQMFIIQDNNEQILDNIDANKQEGDFIMNIVTKKFKPLIESTLINKKNTHKIKEEILLRLVRVLCLEYSPCVYKLILELFISFFEKENSKSQEDTLKYFRVLKKNQFIETLLHLFDLSLMDNKTLIINLLILLMNVVIPISNDKEKVWKIMVFIFLKEKMIFGNACVDKKEQKVSQNKETKKKKLLMNNIIEEETQSNINIEESAIQSDSKNKEKEQIGDNAIENLNEKKDEDIEIELIKQKMPSTVRHSQKKKISFGFDLDLSSFPNEQNKEITDISPQKENENTNKENEEEDNNDEPILEPLIKRHNSFKEIKIKASEFQENDIRKTNPHFSKSTTPHLSINTNAINLQASVTNDNFSYKVFKLAKHCIDYRKGLDNELNCLDDCFNINSRISVSKLNTSPRESSTTTNKESNSPPKESTTNTIENNKPVPIENTFFYPSTIKPNTKPLYDVLEKKNYYKELNDLYEIVESWFIPQSLGVEDASKLIINFEVLPMLLQFVSSSHSLLLVHNLISKIKIFVDEVQQTKIIYHGNGEEKTGKEQKAFKENIKISKKEKEVFQWKLMNIQKFFKSYEFMLWLIETAFHFRIINTLKYTSPLIKDLSNDASLTSSPMEFVQLVIDEVNKIYLELIIQSCSNLDKHSCNYISILITWGMFMKKVLYNPTLPQYTKEIDEFINETLRDFYLDYESQTVINKDELGWFMEILYEYMLFNKNTLFEYKDNKELFQTSTPIMSLLNVKEEGNKLIWADRSLFELYWKYYDLSEQLRSLLQKYLSDADKKDNGVSFKQSLNVVDNIYEFSNCEELYYKIIKKIILGKDNSVTYMLYYKHKPSSIIKLSNVLIAAIIFVDNSNEMQDLVELLNRYQTLLYFIIIASSKSDAEQNKLSPLLNFNLSFLFQKSFFIENEKSQLYSRVLNNILTLIMRTYYMISDIALKEKKSFFSKKPFLSHESALYHLRNNFLEPNNLINNDKLEQLKNENFSNVLDYFRMNMSTLSNIMSIDKFFNVNELFCINEITKIKEQRYSLIQKMKPFYSYKGITCDESLLNEKHSIIKTPYYIQREYYDVIMNIETAVEKVVNKCKYEIYRGKEQRMFEFKYRRNVYRKVKKRLFSYGGLWSDWNVMYDNIGNKKLKKKVLNHYTKTMTRPLLGPIMDLNYYIPNFSGENVQQMFKNENNIYVIDTNINEIYGSDLHINEDVNNDECNLIQSIYKNVINSNIQNVYKTLKSDDEYAKKIFFDNINSYNCEITENEKERLKVFRCCLVKQTHHIQGIINFEKEDNFIFKPIPPNFRNEIKDTLEYDHDRNTCYGSTFKEHSKDKYSCIINISFTNIKFIFKRKYFLRNTALEIFTWNNKNLFFQFYTPEDRTSFLSILKLKNKPDCDDIKVKGRDKGTEIVGYYHYNKQFPLRKPLFTNQDELYSKWKEWQISNMELLMWVNILGNRSYIDLTQYPVFPWVVTNYVNSDKPKKQERNLNIPIGMMKLPPYSKITSNITPSNEDDKHRQFWEMQAKQCEQRRSNFIDNYYFMLNDLKEELQIEIDETDELEIGDEQEQVNIQQQAITKSTEMSKEEEDKIKLNEKYYRKLEKYAKEQKQINKLPYCFGSHYSNPIYVNHFMLRLFPYSVILIEMQGNKFDDPQRLFYSLKQTFLSTTTQKTDVRELIPEFYFLPELFTNINEFDFGKAVEMNDNNKEISFQIDNVILPLWAQNAFHFVITLYIIFEQSRIHDWINIIFGYYQQGRGARKRHNVFLPYSYDGIVNDMNMLNLRMVELGLTPMKVYNEDVSEKTSKPTKQQITVCSKLSSHPRKCRLLSFATSVWYTLGKEKNIMIVFDNYSTGKVGIPENVNDSLNNKNYESPWEQFSQQNGSKVNENMNTNIKNSLSQSMLSPIQSSPLLYPRIAKLHFFTNDIDSYKHHTYISYKEGTVFGIGGFWDGMIIVIDQNKHYHYALKPIDEMSKRKSKDINENGRIDNEYSRDNSPIVFMVKDDKEEFVYCGTMEGTVFQFQIKHNDINDSMNTWLLINSVHHHQREITYINVNTKLNVIGTCGKDHYIYLYRLPNLEIFNSLYIIDFDIDYLFISNAPLPSFIIYCIRESTFRSYSINGGLICVTKATKAQKKRKNIQHNEEEIQEDDNENFDMDGLLISPIIFTDYKFIDYLAYGTMKGEVVIRELPLMKENKRKIALKRNKDSKSLRLSIQKEQTHHIQSLSNQLPDITDNIERIPIRWIGFSSELKTLYVIGDCEHIVTIVNYGSTHATATQSLNSVGFRV